MKEGLLIHFNLKLTIMGLLDSITSMISGGGNISDMIGKILAEKGVSPQIADMLKNLDTSKTQQLVQYIQKNGFPDDAGDIQKIISMLTADKPADKKQVEKKPATKKPEEKKPATKK